MKLDDRKTRIEHEQLGDWSECKVEYKYFLKSIKRTISFSIGLGI